jgi:hypothetical protein
VPPEDGRAVVLAVGRLAVGPIALRLGCAGVEEGVEGPLLVADGEALGNEGDRVGVGAFPPDCPHPAISSPTRRINTTGRVLAIRCSRCHGGAIAPC